MKSTLLFSLILSAAFACAQEAVPPKFGWKDVFFSRDSIALEGAIAADAITTQHNLAHGATEFNPIARPFTTRGAAGQAAFSALQFGATMEGARLLSRHGHPRAARWMIRIMAISEAGYVANNLCMGSKSCIKSVR